MHTNETSCTSCCRLSMSRRKFLASTGALAAVTQTGLLDFADRLDLSLSRYLCRKLRGDLGQPENEDADFFNYVLKGYFDLEPGDFEFVPAVQNEGGDEA